MEWKMEWNENFGMEHGRCQNGMESFKNGMEDNLSYQFHTRLINNIATEVFNFNIYACYLSTNRGTVVVYIAQTVYVLHHCKYIAV